ncbi:Phage terminase GpA [Caballeronia fortuita]|uniref:Phage terminase GpA n=1 Tax=Caballeronia fortuita TaxID=1777138 RepID=A0A158E8N2_9BURK|nr:phage terminase large subunit family protein [Caballeronia fortuita]SAL03144.1 Phage terminase GpA [Caballeronia fortuita]
MNHPFSNLAAVQEAATRAVQNLIPPADMLPSEWASKNIQIPIGNAVPGPINFDNAPYQRGMVNSVVEPGIKRVTFMTGAQLGKTTTQQVITGFFVDHDPRSQIFVMPTQNDVHTFQETKLKPMLEANPRITRKMAKSRGRDGVNNSRMISFVGGFLLFSWAGSPRTLRGRSAPITQADEIDGMEMLEGEGDPLELLDQRASTFGDLAVNTASSTPTVKGHSRIEKRFEDGDQRRYYVPCPDCGEGQYLKWSQVSWEGRDNPEGEQDPDSARYICEHCGSAWSDGDRIAAIRGAEAKGFGWKAAKPFKGHASFHAPEMLSTFRRLRDIVQSYLNKLSAGDLQSFVNVSLGETFEETAEKADPDSLYARREEYTHPVPMRGLYLTAGVDMQPDRLEVEIVAWGLFEESFSVAYRVLYGDPDGSDVWNDLDDLLAEEFDHESGAALSIQATCLDTGGTGGNTQSAYEYIRARRGRKIFAIKGVGGWGRQIVEKPQRKQSGKHSRKVDLYLVGSDEAKLVVMRRLALQKVGPGYCHFPADDEHGQEYFKQITAEKLVTRYVKGFPVREWHKPEKARNEALDCRVYALAALKIMNPSFKQLAKRLILDEKTPEIARKQPESREEWAEKTAERALLIKDALEKVRAATAEKRPETNPHVEPEAPKTETRPIKRAKSLSGGRRRGGFATNW